MDIHTYTFQNPNGKSLIFITVMQWYIVHSTYKGFKHNKMDMLDSHSQISSQLVKYYRDKTDIEVK